MDIAWDLIDKYLAGDCTAEERVQVEEWLAESPIHRQHLHRFRELAVEPDWEVAIEDRERLLADVKAKVGVTLLLRVMPRGAPRWRTKVTRIAAAAALVAGAGAAAAYLAAPIRSQPAAATRVATTPPGQRAVFDLPDGTRVMLGVASRLEYPADFGASRQVRLEGAAYFEVTHDERRPFVVHAGDLVAKDLGTQFVVRAYPDDDYGQVIVREGEVSLANVAAPRSPSVVLSPGELGRLSADGEPVVERADTALHFAWTTGTLVLDNVALRDAIAELSRWFDLDFRLADSTIASRRIAASLTNRPTDDALTFLSRVLGLRVTRQGRTVTLSRS